MEQSLLIAKEYAFQDSQPEGVLQNAMQIARLA
jgi:hypothetical protein